MRATAENKLRVHLVQTSLHWENAEQNMAHFTELLQPLKGCSDLVLLPEMFASGFTMNATKVAQTMEGPTLLWMKEQARFLDAALCGSLVIRHKDAFYNRMLFVCPDGKVHIYDKKHLFRLAQEERVYSPGTTHTSVEWRGFTLILFVCYDLRFPVWCRNTNMADAMLFVANWPRKRALAWNTLLQARAIENQCYVLGVNRVGTDGHGEPFDGDSSVYGPEGEVLAHNKGSELVLEAELDKQALIKSRRKFQFYKDMDAFILK